MNILLAEPQIDWKSAWENKIFRRRTYTGMILLAVILCAFPIFFQAIERRQGAVLNDWLVGSIPAVNVSIPIFICIWSTILLVIIRSLKQPSFFITVLYTYCIISIFRFITISMVELNPPAGLIPLIDPLSNPFYGKGFVTKDLFFSGHTSTLFVMYLCFDQKIDKYFSLVTSTIVGILVLVQHVHYTIDVLAAPIFAFFALKITKKWIISG